jgi:hypothetical protein
VEHSAKLRSLCAAALRAEGLGTLCRDESREYSEWGNRFSYVIMGGVFLGVVSSIADWLDARAIGIGALALATALILGIAGLKIGVRAAAVMLIAAWTVCLVVQLSLDDHDTLETLGAPFAVMAVGVATLRTRRLLIVGRSAPLLLPIALTVLLIPLFTADLWQAVNRLTLGNIVALACLALAPLAVAVAHQVRGRVSAVLKNEAENLDRQEVADYLQSRFIRLLPEDERDGASNWLNDRVTRLAEIGNESLATDQLIRPMRRQAVRTLVTVVAGSVCAAAAYFWLLAWTLVPAATASSWIGDEVQMRSVDLGVVNFDAPVDPYGLVALLLSVAATSVMFGSAVVEEGLERRLVVALFRHPTRNAIALAMAYLELRTDARSAEPSTEGA